MSEQLTCREFVDFLMDYLEGAARARVEAPFEEHMDLCPSCVTYLDTYRETVALGKKLLCEPPDSPVPQDVPEDLVSAILAARKR